MSVRTRFAPSPTGFMHVGNLRTALYAFLLARSQGGRFLLRIEDTDQARYVEGAVEVIYKTLAAAGIDHDEGPDVGGDFGPYVQSERKGLYLPYAKELVETGAAYYCFCEKAEPAESAEGEEPSFDCDDPCRTLDPETVKANLAAGKPYVIRQRIDRAGVSTYHDAVYGEITIENKVLDDQILLKRDGMPTYNFANVIDDYTMGITHVIRGMEYLSSTPKYNLLYKALGWDIPQYIHLPTVMRDSKHKLSKRDGDAYYSDFIKKGYLTEALINYLALVGWNPGDEREFFTMEELVDAFSVEGLSKSPAIFDINKLTWFNAEYIRRMDPADYYEKALPWFRQELGGLDMDFRRLAELMQPRTDVFSSIPEMVRFLRSIPEYDPGMFDNKKQKSSLQTAGTALIKAKQFLASVSEWTEKALHDALISGIASEGLKNGTVLWPLRIALSGQLSTPGGAVEIAYLLGREETGRRLDAALERFES